ncbi:hypothetical protein ACHMZP_33300 [Rhodococcus baikonurensis]|uniref:hypothetical protein n=1 Tax=Rhodococcus baikonurensis TaxID=172041 RepID=UPI0037A73052
MNDVQLTLFDIELRDVVALREWPERMLPRRTSYTSSPATWTGSEASERTNTNGNTFADKATRA